MTDTNADLVAALEEARVYMAAFVARDERRSRSNTPHPLTPAIRQIDAALARAKAGSGEDVAKRTMTLTLTDTEIAALEEMVAEKQMAAPAVFRNSFRLYQMVHRGLASILVHQSDPLDRPQVITIHQEPRS